MFCKSVLCKVKSVFSIQNDEKGGFPELPFAYHHGIFYVDIDIISLSSSKMLISDTLIEHLQKGNTDGHGWIVES